MWQWIKNYFAELKENRQLKRGLYRDARLTIEELKSNKEFHDIIAKRIGVSLDKTPPEKLNPRKIAAMTEKLQQSDLFDVSKFEEYREHMLAQNCCAVPPEGKVYAGIIRRIDDPEEVLTTLDSPPYIVCEDDLELLSKEELQAFEVLTNAMLARKRAALGR
jgi:hypothetical protein